MSPRRRSRNPAHRPGAAIDHAGAAGMVVEAATPALWLYGLHAVQAALANPVRRNRRLVGTAAGLEALAGLPELPGLADSGNPSAALSPLPPAEKLDRAGLERLLPAGAVHQGVALNTAPLPELSLEAFQETLPSGPQILVLLDQVEDPHNVGAILRSAAAFSAAGVLVQERHSPPVTGVLAKAASGALEHVPLIRVTNLARALDQLHRAGFWSLGLDSEALAPLLPNGPAEENRVATRVVLILGAEGRGLRRLTREKCDRLVRLPTTGAIRSLNVSNAAAIALYSLVSGQAFEKK